MPVRRGKTIEIGQVVVGAVGNGLEAVEGEAVRLRDAGHGGRFHIDHDGLVFVRQFTLFADVGNVIEGDEALAVGVGRGEDFARGVVDDLADGVGAGDLESAGKRAGPADGDKRVERAGGEELLAGAGDVGCAHAGAGGNGIAAAEASAEDGSVVLPFVDERFELGGEGGDDGDASHLNLL